MIDNNRSSHAQGDMGDVCRIRMNEGMPSLEQIGRVLYTLRGLGTHKYSYTVCGSGRVHDGQMNIEQMQPNGYIIGYDYGCKQRFKIRGA